MKSGLSMLRKAAATVALGLCALATAAPGGVNAGACKGTVYLTFDTGSMSQAELIADTLRRHRIHATFFLANEKTIHGDSTLDDRWAAYWKSLAADGHA
ncbi:polysaccharide deacetylase family protein, partial [Escherichia coli]